MGSNLRSMPIDTRSPEAAGTDTACVSGPVRAGDDPVGASLPLPEELLPSGGGDQLLWGEGLADARDRSFRRQVAAIHRQLQPVRTHAALASSYAREAGT